MYVVLYVSVFSPVVLPMPLFSSDAPDAADPDASSSWKPLAAVGGLVAGVAATGKALRWARQQTLPVGPLSPPALEATVEPFALMEGTARCYHRPGTGTPLVFLHSFNAAASSYEMKPLFEHYAETTDRPLFALDWLGFGLSDRPDIVYRPALFQRQLRRFLSERVPAAADVIALSLGGEYAATVALTSPFLVRSLVLISPTSLGARSNVKSTRKALVHSLAATGAFELFFYRLARRASIRSYYERQVFQDAADVDEELVDYAYLTANVKGAHYAPRYFVAGDLFLSEAARTAYAKLQVPTLMVIPDLPGETVQRFERLAHTRARNADYLHLHSIKAGLMPQWDRLSALTSAIDSFSNASS